MKNLINLIREDLRDFSPYSSARTEATKGRIWLNANESPWDVVSINGINQNRYLEQQPPELIDRLSDYYQVAKENILVTRGGDEGIDLLLRLLCRSGQDATLTCTPTYGMYEVSTKLQGAKFIKVPLQKENFQLDLPAMQKACEDSVKIVFLCSPNNPTGNLLNKEDIFSLCDYLSAKAVVVVDEAYIDFSSEASLSSYINQYDNLVVLHTFSKAFGLAAARVGTLVADSEIIQWLKGILAPYPLAALSVASVLCALKADTLNQIQQKIQLIVAEREAMIENLRGLSIVEKVWPSQTNFVLVKLNKPVMQVCSEQGVVLRDMTSRVDLDNVVRISIGLPSQNEEVIKLLRKL